MTNKAAQLVQLLRSTKREKRLGTVILFVTSRCNAFCQTCFYHEELNQPGDMTFAQIEKVSRTMPSITDLWLSGGEPTLRRDLLAHIFLWPVASLLYLYNAVVAGFSRRIKWRGITYELKSPREAVIISRES